MNFKDYKSLKIGDYQLKKLVRASDGAVLFDISTPTPTPTPENWFEIEYDGNQSSIFIGTIYAGYFGGNVEISWGTEKQTVTVPSGGEGLTIRRDGISGMMTIRFGWPSEFFIPSVNSRTMLGILTLRDGGNNLKFRNAQDSSGAAKPGTFNWTNLNTIDLSKCTAVPYVTQQDNIDNNSSLRRIIIPKSMESDFLNSGIWNKYSNLFVTV